MSLHGPNKSLPSNEIAVFLRIACTQLSVRHDSEGQAVPIGLAYKGRRGGVALKYQGGWGQ